MAENREKSGKSRTVNHPGDAFATNESRTTNESETTSEQKSVTVERTNELARRMTELISRQIKRYENGEASGMWRTTTQVLAKKGLTATRVADLLCGALGDADMALAQLRSVKLPDNEVETVPVLDLGLTRLNCVESALGEEFSGVSTLLTSEELAKICALPLHEVPGIVVEKMTDFGRNLPPTRDGESVLLGVAVDHEQVTDRKLRLGFEQLKRHVFVTGATGAGKSTTMRQLLLNLYNPVGEKHIPFLVIEPVKREYRELRKWIPELQVITLGDPACEVSLSPFDYEPVLGRDAHIDNLKAAFNASMGNYSSMPFILEDILYKAYEQNERLRAAGASVASAPRMSELLPFVEESIQHFFEGRSSDYGNSLLGALRARISSMTRGAKGKVLDSIENAIDMGMLMKKPCVIELWPFTDNEEKAFVMALLMIKLYEYRQKIDVETPSATDHPLDHVLVVEEAHRLLSKPQGGGEHSSNGRQKAVEFFADMLAEIRSYGQGIVIVDQIPSKLIPDVIKNTDVKIAHRLTDREDREVMGGAMNLTKEQVAEVARLTPGAGIVYYGGLRQAVKVMVRPKSEVEESLEKINEARELGFYDD